MKLCTSNSFATLTSVCVPLTLTDHDLLWRVKSWACCVNNHIGSHSFKDSAKRLVVNQVSEMICYPIDRLDWASNVD